MPRMTLAHCLLDQATCGDPALEASAALVFRMHAASRALPGPRPTLDQIARSPSAEIERQIRVLQGRQH